MQGSINRLTDVFERSIVAPEAATRKDLAVKCVPQLEDDLSINEQLTLIRQFDKHKGLGGTYLSLVDSEKNTPAPIPTDDSLRKAWVRKTLQDAEEEERTT